MAALEKSEKVKTVEMDVKVSISKKPDSPPGKGGGKTPPEPDQAIQWGVEDIKADDAWTTSTGSGVRVGVIDTGIDKDHPDLEENIVDGINYVIKGKGKLKTDNWNDGNGHGTYVAGIIAAKDNDIGVVGVAPDVDLYIVKALGDDGWGYESDVVAGIDWCVEQGVQVISMSLGDDPGTTALRDACANAYSEGVILVAAAGNDGPRYDEDYEEGDDSIGYPAWYPSVIAVGMMINLGQWENERLWGSAAGPSLELMAPGTRILSTWNDGGYTMYAKSKYGNMLISGTSVACPHVAGTIALVLGTTPTEEWNSEYDTTDNDVWDPDEVRQLLQDTADDLWSVDDPPSPLYGWGRVDA
ncbi:MAG: S8 family peptidase, partial [Thermoplasmata archaeon]|nr:S8 family peptidase [Thermoplasmata archaeon]